MHAPASFTQSSLSQSNCIEANRPPSARFPPPMSPKALSGSAKTGVCEVRQGHTTSQGSDICLMDVKNNDNTANVSCTYATESSSAECDALPEIRSCLSPILRQPEASTSKTFSITSCVSHNASVPEVHVPRTSSPQVSSFSSCAFPVLDPAPLGFSPGSPLSLPDNLSEEESARSGPSVFARQPGLLPAHAQCPQRGPDELTVARAQSDGQMPKIGAKNVPARPSEGFVDASGAGVSPKTKGKDAQGDKKRGAARLASKLPFAKDVAGFPSKNRNETKKNAPTNRMLESKRDKKGCFTGVSSVRGHDTTTAEAPTILPLNTGKSSTLRESLSPEGDFDISQRENPASETCEENPTLTDVFSSENVSCSKNPDEKDPEVTVEEQEDSESNFDSDAAEALALRKYLHMTVADLSMSTFLRIGAHLSSSRTLREINLKSCTIPNEGLLGLADIPSLEVVRVSHMRQLTSLRPLITRRGVFSPSIRHIHAQCTSVNNEGIIGLEKMKCLQSVDLGFTRVTNVTLLRACYALVDLNLTGTHVTTEGICGLEEIKTLKTLDISRTKVGSLRNISKSKSLVDLTAYSCKVDDDGLVGLEKMPNLRTLDISTSKVTNMSILGLSKSLKSITAQWLSLQNCGSIIAERRLRQGDGSFANLIGEKRTELSNLSMTSTADKEGPNFDVGYRGLAAIPTLQHVDLSFNAIRNVKALFLSRSINSIVLKRTLVDNEGIKGIQKLRTLRTLVVSNYSRLCASNASKDISVSSREDSILSSVTELNMVVSLTVLDLSFTDVYDLGMVSALVQLRELILVETLVTVDGLSGVGRLPALQVLDISQNSILSLNFLTPKSKALRKVIVKSNRYVRGFCVGNLSSLTSLETLDISDTIVEDIQKLFRPSFNLRELIWRWGERRDSTGCVDALPCCVNSAQLIGIECMPRIQLIDITNSEVDSLAFLSSSKSLRRLVLARCAKLDDWGIKGLERIPTLAEIDLSYASGIRSVRCLASSRSLRVLKIGWTGVVEEDKKYICAHSSIKLLEETSREDSDNGGNSNEGISQGSFNAQKFTKFSFSKKRSTVNSELSEGKFKKRTLKSVSFA